MNDKTVITCALTGVLTDPKQHPVPVTPAEMAREAKAAFDAGAAVMHVHFRQQAPGKGHLPSWEPELAATIMQAIRDACPGVILNESTGTIGPNIAGSIACLRAVKPEIAACNAGSLNYLKVRADGSWAWPPHVFDNAPDKVKAYLDVMAETHTRPEFECFDVGIVRCVGMYAQNGMFKGLPKYNFVMGVASGMPADPDLLPILKKLAIAGAPWQVTAIGRAEIWPLHRRAAELGGHLRTGLEDTFYLPDGSKVGSNGTLVEMLARYAREAGRAVASPADARKLMRLEAAA
jgi:3-keto-5-aminohexanoate cleavage enzyme